LLIFHNLFDGGGHCECEEKNPNGAGHAAVKRTILKILNLNLNQNKKNIYCRDSNTIFGKKVELSPLDISSPPLVLLV
jgi:Uma2 family endonuclease